MKITISTAYGCGTSIAIPSEDFNPRLLEQDGAIKYTDCEVMISIYSLKKDEHVNEYLHILSSLYNDIFFNKYKVYNTSLILGKAMIPQSYRRYIYDIDNLWAQAFLSTYSRSIAECCMEYNFRNWRTCVAKSIDLYGKADIYCMNYMLKTWIFDKEVDK